MPTDGSTLSAFNDGQPQGLVEVRAATKRFGELYALRSVDLTVGQGEVVVVLVVLC
ncbi:hypothetical protein GCM10022255_107160 [Dactylosporangium darangshiense]|uniref:ABC transporter ATP-binding protein n=1 Tax=Dactylosporangium darangshiense TaxID=579108 RepID=A0ABP8DTK9_9ACTN